jgi:ribosomal protein L29
MASEKYKQLQEMSDTDLRTELDTTLTQYQKLRFDHVIKGLENPIGLRDGGNVNSVSYRRKQSLNAASSEQDAGLNNSKENFQNRHSSR